jgi:hypothetical protein
MLTSDADAVLAGTGPGHRLRDSAVAAVRGLPVLRAACCYLLLPAATCCYLLYRLAKNLESDLQKLNFAAMET